MGGNLIPQGIGALSPWYLNPLENLVTVQFDHRWLAVFLGLLLTTWYLRGRSTLLMQVPVLLGALHQAGALLLFSALLFNIHALSRV